MSVFHIYCEDGKKKAKQVSSMEQFVAIVNSEENIRNSRLAMEGDENAKSRLVQMNYQSNFLHNNGLLKGCSEYPTTTVQIDVDFDPKDPFMEDKKKELIEKVMAMKNEIGLKKLDETRKGIHLVVARIKELSQEDNLKRISELLGVPYDENAKDLTRVFYTMDTSRTVYIDEEIFKQEDAPFVPNADEKRKRSAKPADTAHEVEAEPTRHEHTDENGILRYKGLPFSAEEVIGRYWEMFNDGMKPSMGNRNRLTHELAQQLSYFTGDAEKLNSWIPSYDGFDEEEKRRCIASALNARPTIIPRKIRTVMESLMADEPKWNRLPRGLAPMGIKESITACPEGFDLIVIIAVAPIIGALATNVKITYNGLTHHINLFSYVVGYSGSNKGSLTGVIKTWMKELTEQDEANFKKEQEYKKQRRAARNKQQQPEEPQLVYRTATFNSTYAAFIHRLSSSAGMHLYGYSPESDELRFSWGSDMGQLSVILRDAFTNDSYERQTKGDDSVSVNIPSVKLNATLCGTPDAMKSLFPNPVDGLVSRTAFISTPDNTFKRLEPYTPLTEEQKQTIAQVAHLLTLMKGQAHPKKLERRALEWLDAILVESIQMNDKVLGSVRKRIHEIAYRIICTLMLCRVAEVLIKENGYEGAKAMLEQNPNSWIPLMEKAQTKAVLDTFDIVADSMLNEHLRYFRRSIERHLASEAYDVPPVGRRTTSLNDSILDELPGTFTYNDALAAAKAKKGNNISRNSVSSMLGSWKEKNKVRKEGSGYVKTY